MAPRVRQLRSAQLNVSLTPDEHERVAALAEAEGSTLSIVGRRLLLRGVEAARCACRPARQHPECAYCGSQPGERVCGVCSASGVEGHVIRGTEARRCAVHR